MKIGFLSFIVGICLVGLLFNPLVAQSHQRFRSYNNVAVDFPLDGGGMLMASKIWSLNKHIRGGFVVGGGVIQRDFEITVVGAPNFQAETKAMVLPYFGPQITFFYNVVGLSLSYGAFYAKTDFEVSGDTIGSLSGEKSGWGTGFYSPLLVLDFYSEKHNLIFGFGLGAFFGTSYPKLVAESATARVESDRNPLDTITFHVRTAWSGSLFNRSNPMEEDDEDF